MGFPFACQIKRAWCGVVTSVALIVFAAGDGGAFAQTDIQRNDNSIGVLDKSPADKGSQPITGTVTPTTSASGDKSKKKKATARRGNAPCLCWIDSDHPAKAVILCVHGLGLHNGTYESFGERFCKNGFAVYAIDVRGFGSWIAAKGRERVDFEGCMEDVKSTLHVLHRAHPGLPVFILGESMGGAIALRATAMFPDLVQGLISSVPAGDRFKQGSARLKVALHLLDSANKPIDMGEIVDQATQKPEVRKAWINDPLNKLNLSPNELIQFQHFMNQNHESAKLIKDTPVLFVQGCQDRLVRPEGTVELFNKLATPDRQLELISNGEHLIFEENQFTDEDIKIVSDWMAKHLTASAKQDVTAGQTILPEQADNKQ